MTGCKCDLLEEAHIYLRNKNISFQKEEVTYEEHGQFYDLPVLEGNCATGIESGFLNDRLIDRNLDLLCKLSVSALSSD